MRSSGNHLKKINYQQKLKEDLCATVEQNERLVKELTKSKNDRDKLVEQIIKLPYVMSRLQEKKDIGKKHIMQEALELLHCIPSDISSERRNKENRSALS